MQITAQQTSALRLFATGRSGGRAAPSADGRTSEFRVGDNVTFSKSQGAH